MLTMGYWLFTYAMRMGGGEAISGRRALPDQVQRAHDPGGRLQRPHMAFEGASGDETGHFGRLVVVAIAAVRHAQRLFSPGNQAVQAAHPWNCPQARLEPHRRERWHAGFEPRRAR